MARIARVLAHEILDSRGHPTLSVEVALEDGSSGTAKVPAGASTGSREARELRDGDPSRYGGRGVQKAVAHVEGELARAVVGLPAEDQEAVDRALREADGTRDKSRLGANAIVGVSLAVARAQAASAGTPLHRHLAGLFARTAPGEGAPDGGAAGGPGGRVRLPVPLMNVVNGGSHAPNRLDFQEFMLVPWGFPTFAEALRAGVEVYHALGRLLSEYGLAAGVGDEGGFAPPFSRNLEAVEVLVWAIERAGYRPGDEVALALDPAASVFYRDGRYVLAGEGRALDSGELVDLYEDWASRHPIVSIEDGLAEDDREGWRELARRLGRRLQLVGDDLFVTDPELVRRGAEDGLANAVLVKVNQVGTLSEALATIRTARRFGWAAIVSHRSGETDDTTIADLAVGAGCGQIKAGAPARGERVAKYNRLLAIEREAGPTAEFPGRDAFAVLQ
ncbi:MAG: phosphopyruvate hydratase [Clostridia bacterium]|nr:phosphopyruvate hydratase [Clostridia bacterium]